MITIINALIIAFWPIPIVFFSMLILNYYEGSLTRDEMTSMFLMMYQDPDLTKAEQKIAVKEITSKAEEMFVKLDADSNGFVTMEEFIIGSLSDGGQNKNSN